MARVVSTANQTKKQALAELTTDVTKGTKKTSSSLTQSKEEAFAELSKDVTIGTQKNTYSSATGGGRRIGGGGSSGSPVSFTKKTSSSLTQSKEEALAELSKDVTQGTKKNTYSSATSSIDEAQAKLEAERIKLEAEAKAQAEKVEALNRLQQAKSKGTVINRADLTKTGLNYGQIAGPAGLANLNKKASQLNAENEKILNRAEEFNKKTETTLLGLSPYGYSSEQGITIIKENKPEKPQAFFAEKPKKEKNQTVFENPNANPIDLFISSAGAAIFGLEAQGKGIEGIFGGYKGGAAERGFTAFSTTGLGFTEFGENIGGTPGKVAGAVVGSAVGLGLGAFEAGPRSAILSFENFISSPGGGGRIFGGTSSFLGQAYGFTGDVIGVSRAPAAIGKEVVTLFKETPATIRGIENIFNTGRSIYNASFAERAAIATEKVINAGGKAKEVITPVIQNPFINLPGRTIAAFTGVEVARSASKVSASEDYRAFVSSPEGNVKFQQGTALNETKQQEKGIISTLGGAVGTGFLGETRSEFGGLSNTEIEQSFRQAGVPEKFIKYAAKEYRFSQAGGLFGQISLGSTTETGGRFTIGEIIVKGLSGKAIGLGEKEASLQAFNLTKKTVLPFAALGFYEGIGSTIISEQASGKIKGVKEIPKAISEDPLKYITSGVFGAGSSVFLGATLIDFSVYGALRGGSKGAKVGEKGTLYAGYALDLTEKPGDVFADLFGPGEPKFRTVRPRGSTTSSILELISSPQEVAAENKRIKSKVKSQNTLFDFFTPDNRSIYTPSSTRANSLTSTSIFNFNPNVSLPLFNETTQNVDLFQEENQNPNEPIDESVTAETPVNFNIPIGVPVSRIGGLFPLPAAPYGEGGIGKGKKNRKIYINEFAAAVSLLGPNLNKLASKTAKENRSFFNVSRRKSKKANRRRR